MKILHIVRHAEAVSKNKGLPDFERALVKKGIKGARSVVKRLRQSGYDADAMISSPASRALETAHVFAKELSFPLGRIDLHSGIYDDGRMESLLVLVKALPPTVSDAFLFGHDPSFSEFAHFLLPDFNHTMPKGAVVSVSFDTVSWSDVGPGQGQLIGFDYPISKTEEERRHKALRREISDLFATAMQNELQKLDPRAAEKMKSYADKAARKAAERFIELTPSYRSGTRPIPGAKETGPALKPRSES